MMYGPFLKPERSSIWFTVHSLVRGIAGLSLAQELSGESSGARNADPRTCSLPRTIHTIHLLSLKRFPTNRYEPKLARKPDSERSWKRNHGFFRSHTSEPRLREKLGSLTLAMIIVRIVATILLLHTQDCNCNNCNNSSNN